jgi:hypothetical protein
MKLDWEGMYKRYIADETRTPYRVPVRRLTRTQARYELFIYTFFTGIIFGVLTIATLSPALPHGSTLGVPLYCASVLAAAIVLGIFKHEAAAAWCAAAPAGALIYFAVWGFLPKHGPFEKTVLVLLFLGWLAYGWRVMAIVRAWPNLGDGPRPQ